MKKYILAIVCICYTLNPSFSQKIPGKFGKPPAEYLSSKVCPIDSSAGAYVVYDYGQISFDYVEHKGIYWTQKRHLVLKILKKSEYDQATFVIPLHEDNNGKEEVLGLKGATYNMKNGKKLVSKIKSRDAIQEQASDNLVLYKFTLPNVEEGSLIEVTYNLVSEFATYLRDWNFQWDIPVMHSEIMLSIPEWLNYHQNMKGYHSLTKSDYSRGYGRIGTSGANVLMFQKHFIANNLPALKSEAFVDNIDNYRSSVQFELESVRFGTDIRNYTTDWSAVSDKFLKFSYFGQRLDKSGYAAKEVEELSVKYPDKEELMHAIYQFVKSKMKWNGEMGFTAEMSLRRVYNEGSGKSADINFILINLLREGGINAYPVVLSTRDNGYIFPAYPTMDGFNNVVALAELNGEKILLDASDPYCTPGILPPRCINGKGRIIDKTVNEWVNLDPQAVYEEFIMYDLIMDETGEFTGKIVFRESGYAARNVRQKLANALSEEKFIEDVENDFPGLQILEHKLDGTEDLNGPVAGEYNVEIKNMSEFMGDLISINPFMFERIKENPLKIEERKFPVNLNYPLKTQYLLKCKLPEGYIVESLPDNINMAFPDKTAKFLFTAAMVGEFLTVNAVLQFDRYLYTSEEYKILKMFYEQLVAKQSEMIVVKKTQTTL
ncbi:MAG: hypothetical protein ACOCUP_03080 [bacterium]